MVAPFPARPGFVAGASWPVAARLELRRILLRARAGRRGFDPRYEVRAAAGGLRADEEFILRKTGLIGDQLVVADIGRGEWIWACTHCETIHTASPGYSGCPHHRGGPDVIVVAP